MSFQVSEVDRRAVLTPFEPTRGCDEVSNKGCPDRSAATVSIW